MDRISQEQNDKWVELCERLANTEHTVKATVDLLVSAVSEYNLLTDEVGEFIDQIEERMLARYNNGPENWKNGQGGEAYRNWRYAWENAFPQEIDFEPPHFSLTAEQLKQLPRKPGG